MSAAKTSAPKKSATVKFASIGSAVPAAQAGCQPSRRQFIRQLGTLLAISPVAGLLGCGSGSSDSAGTTTSTGTGTGTGTSTGSSTSWASGGTSVMTANFPADTLFDLGSSCDLSLTKNLTEGPCYFKVSTMDDISEGQTGLPMQLCLRVVNRSCQPQAGLEVEVWHCDVEGLYSGNTTGSSDAGRFAGSFCTSNDSDAVKARWFRGIAITDSNGRVNFKSCFPGWYSGRTIHIHFRVRNNNNDQVVSQCCFPDSLTEEICTTHPNYQGRGKQDTTLGAGRDNVFGSSYSDFLFNTARNSDGSILAWKTIRLS